MGGRQTARASLPTNPSKADLVSAVRAVKPGTSFEVALRLQMQPGWHVYWRNPGESGLAPTVTWHLPSGWIAGPIEWPVPTRLSTDGIVTYTYEHDVLLPVRITVPAGSPPGPAAVQATAKWLVCREGCIPAQATLRVPLRIAERETPDPVWAQRIASAQARLPASTGALDFSAQRVKDTIELKLRWKATPGVAEGKGSGSLPANFSFFPADTTIEPSAPQPATVAGADRVLQLKVSSYAPPSTERLRGLLVTPSGETWPWGARAISIDIPIQRTNL